MTPEPDFERLVQEEQERLRAESLPRSSDAAVPLGDSSVRHGGGYRVPLPRIRCNGRQLRDISRDALRALQARNSPPVLFVRGGTMVAVILNEKKRQVISEIGVDALCGLLTRCADYYKVSANGHEYDCAPPAAVVKDILALPPGEWNFPPLDALTEIPIVRPDGSILDSPGYDSATRLYYSPDPSLSIRALSDTPSSDHIEIALELIHQAIGEFPYADEASYANAIAAMLTPIIKPAIDAPAPLANFDAPQAGTGKSLLCDVISIIATGRAGEMFSAPKDEDEWRKVITTALMSGTSVVIFDNVVRPLESGDLCSVLTASTWADRAMRTHCKIALPVSEPRQRSGAFGYRAEEPTAFCPRTHASMILKSGSSWDVNCLPPCWVSAMPPTSGARGINSNRLVSGLPATTSFETI